MTRTRQSLRTSLLLASFAAAGCDSRVTFVEPTGPRGYFERYVVPELDRRCAAEGCHGVAIDRYRTRGPGWFSLAVDPEGSIASTEAVDIAYAEATGAVVIAPSPGDTVETQRLKRESAARRIDRQAAAIFSELIRKPLPVALGGLPHRGGENYVSLRSQGLDHLVEWIEMEQMEEELLLDPNEAIFGRDVMPVLVEKGCAVTSCHGPYVGNPFKLEAGIGGAFGANMLHHNYKTARKFLNDSTTDPTQSRILKKGLSPELGGIAHRGSNELFTDAEELGLAQVKRWITSEQAATTVDPTPSGVVLVERPTSPRPYFDVGAWTPGADLLLLPLDSPGAAPLNLTAAHHTGPADIRTPEISPDGREILFAMRTSVTDCLNIYRLGIDGRDLTPLTFDTGCRAASFGPTHANAANLSPRYSPNGKIYFVSTRAGVIADKGNYPATHIWAVGPTGAELTQITHSPGHEIDLSIASKAGKAILVFTALKDITLNRHGALYFIPPDWSSDYHPMFGEQSRYPIFAQSSELPDRRTVVTLQGWNGRFQAGALAIFDRNMGPDLEDPADMSQVAIPGFLPAMALLSDDASALERGPATLYRNPIALPDGTMIVSRSTDAVDVRSSTAAVTFELVRLSLRTHEVTRMPEIASAEALYQASGRWAVEPALVVERKLPATGETYLRTDLPTGSGVIQFYDAFTLETILRDNRPIGRASMVQPDITAMRAVFGRGLTPEEATPIDPSRVRNGDPASTRISNGVHGRRWAIGPIPVSSDGSVHFSLPSRQPFFLETLGRDGMAIGMQYDRWLFLSEGEAFGNGVATKTFDAVCGGCHGSYSGAPEESFGGVDVVTSPSVTLATHVDAETRRPPFDPVRAGAVTVSSFKRDLGPLLSARCAGGACHSAADRAGGLDLSASPDYEGPWSNAYESLMRLGSGSGSALAGAFRKEYVDERDARAARSYLVEKIFDRELEAPRALTRSGCSAASVLTEEEKQKVVVWIDTGATFLGRDDP